MNDFELSLKLFWFVLTHFLMFRKYKHIGKSGCIVEMNRIPNECYRNSFQEMAYNLNNELGLHLQCAIVCYIYYKCTPMFMYVYELDVFHL